MKIAIQLTCCNLALEKLIQYSIVINCFVIRLLSRSACLVAAEGESTGLKQHLAVPRVSFVPEPIVLQSDYPVQDTAFFVTVISGAQPAFDFEFNDFSKLGLKPLKL